MIIIYVAADLENQKDLENHKTVVRTFAIFHSATTEIIQTENPK